MTIKECLKHPGQMAKNAAGLFVQYAPTYDSYPILVVNGPEYDWYPLAELDSLTGNDWVEITRAEWSGRDK